MACFVKICTHEKHQPHSIYCVFWKAKNQTRPMPEYKIKSCGNFHSIWCRELTSLWMLPWFKPHPAVESALLWPCGCNILHTSSWHQITVKHVPGIFHVWFWVLAAHFVTAITMVKPNYSYAMLSHETSFKWITLYNTVQWSKVILNDWYEWM